MTTRAQRHQRRSGDATTTRRVMTATATATEASATTAATATTAASSSSSSSRQRPQATASSQSDARIPTAPSATVDAVPELHSSDSDASQEEDNTPVPQRAQQPLPQPFGDIEGLTNLSQEELVRLHARVAAAQNHILDQLTEAQMQEKLLLSLSSNPQPDYADAEDSQNDFRSKLLELIEEDEDNHGASSQ